MKHKKSMILILILLCIAVVLVFALKNQFDDLALKIVPKQVNNVFIEVMAIPKTIEITDKKEIDNVIDKLQLHKWTKKKSWDLLYAPNLFVGFKEGEYIGLFGENEKYAKIETKQKSEYYIVPTEIYNDIYSIFLANKDEKVIKSNSFKPMSALDLPKKYSPETAIANGDVVNVHGDITNIERFNEFLSNFQNRQPDLIRITGYTIEGDPIITVAYYDGSQIEVYEDSTRDEFAGDYKGINKYIGNEIIEEIYGEKVKYKRYIMRSERDVLLLMIELKEGTGDEYQVNI